MPKKKVKKVQLSKRDKVLTGLVGGVAEYFNIDPTLLRILTIITAAMTGFVPMLIAYVVATILVSQQT